MYFLPCCVPQKLDPLDTLVMRLCGALFLGNSFTALSATSFRYDEDRSYYLQSAMVVRHFERIVKIIKGPLIRSIFTR